MAINAGVGAHRAWVSVGGVQFPLLEGSVHRTATKKSGSFSGALPLSWAGAESTFAGLGDNQSSIIVETRGRSGTLMTGEIDQVEIDYIAGTIHFSGRDASAKLHATKSTEKWVNKQPHEIVKDVAQRAGLSANVDPQSLAAGRYVEIDYAKLTNGVSLAHVLHKMCDFMGAHWYVSGSKLNVKSTTSSAAPYVVNYSAGPPKVSDALRLQISRNIQAGKPIKVTVDSWHARKAQKFSGDYTVGGNGSTQNYSYNLPGLTQDHAKQHAKARAKDHARHELSLTVELVGDLSIDIAQPLQLTGTHFAQTFKIDSIEDRFGMSGHTMSVSAKSGKKGRPGNDG